MKSGNTFSLVLENLSASHNTATGKIVKLSYTGIDGMPRLLEIDLDSIEAIVTLALDNEEKEN